MSLPELPRVCNEELLERIKNLKGEENRIVAEVVLHLHEIDSRGIYRDAGYSSLFIYCCQALGYSEGAAFRRVRAARCLKSSPDVYRLISDGKLSLSALAEVSPVMNESNSREVLTLTAGASKTKANEIAVRFGAAQLEKRATVRLRKVEQKAAAADLFSSPPAAKPVQVEERYSFSFEVSKEVAALYEEAKALIGPCVIADVFERTLREFVSKRKPKSIKPRKTSPAKSVSRAIPKATRRAVFERDQERCTYRSPDGVRCSEHRCLEVDHIVPVARGGSSEIDNLRLVCRAHNQLFAEQWFGREFISAKRKAVANRTLRSSERSELLGVHTYGRSSNR